MSKYGNRFDTRQIRLIALGGFAIVALVVVGLRLGGVVEGARLNLFAVEVARQVHGDASSDDVALNNAPALPEAERLKGMLLLTSGDLAGADQRFTEAIERNVSLVPLVRAARPGAEALARTAYRLYPDIPDSPAWLADTLPDAAIAEKLLYYREAAALEPDDNLLWEKVGELAVAAQQNDVALDAFQRACDINPIRNGACHQAARFYYARGDWERVIRYFERGSLPEHPPDWVLLIKAARNLNRPAEETRYQ